MKVVTSRLSDKSDEQLMIDIVQGVESSFSELYDRYNKKLVWYFYRMLGQSQQRAEDSMQDVFMKIIEKPKSFDTNKKFSTWVFTIAHNMCKNEYRKASVRIENAHKIEREEVTEQRYDEQIDRSEFKEKLSAQLSLLDESHRSTFMLRNKYGFSIKQIAEILECSEGTIKSRLFYTTKKLSEKLSLYNPNK